MTYKTFVSSMFIIVLFCFFIVFIYLFIMLIYLCVSFFKCIF
nr:MAG TPA: hypothetical protein [Crassvirales sp.]